MKVCSIPTLIIASICLTIAISDFLAWSRRDEKKSWMAFILICLGGFSFCLFCSGEYNVDFPLQSVFWLRGEVIASTISGFALLWFIAEETKLIKRRYVALPFGLDFAYKEVGRGIILIVIDSLIGIGVIRFVFLMEYAWLATILVVGLRRSNELGLPGISKVFYLSDNLLRREGKVFGLSAFGQDLTERIKTEEQIGRSLAEKEILLREVYHRTKNNMSVIISILRLHANAIGDDRLKAAFAVSIDRILSMSLVHNQLYKTGDFSHIDLMSYLRGLGEAIGRELHPDRERARHERAQIRIPERQDGRNPHPAEQGR